MVTVMLDLDGVMVDLDKFIHEIFNRDYKDSVKDIGADVLWGKLGEIPHMFLNLDPMPNYKTLYNYLKSLEKANVIHLEILTSLPYSTNKLVTARQDKIDWVKQYLDKDIVVNTVVGGAKKAKFVKTPTDILIDDMQKNIDAWNAAGARGILFVNNSDTIAQLDRLLGL